MFLLLMSATTAKHVKNDLLKGSGGHKTTPRAHKQQEVWLPHLRFNIFPHPPFPLQAQVSCLQS